MNSSSDSVAITPSEFASPSLAGEVCEPSGVERIARGLTVAQRMYVRDGSIHGDCSMMTVRALKFKGLFELVIDSPNGQCGFMRLTPLGERVRSALTVAPKARRSTSQRSAEGAQGRAESAPKPTEHPSTHPHKGASS